VTAAFNFIEAEVTQITDLGERTELYPPVDEGLMIVSNVEGATSLNGRWHSEDGVYIPAYSNDAATTGADIVSIPTVPVTQDMIIDKVQLQVQDAGGTASILGANNAADIKIYAYNPLWIGEKITLLNYTDPNSIYRHGGTISQSVINSKIYQTFTVSNPRFVPSGWMLAVETPQDYSLDLNIANISGQFATAPLKIDPGFFGEGIGNVAAIEFNAPEGDNLLDNGYLTGIADGEIPDWPDDDTLNDQIYVFNSRVTINPTSEDISAIKQYIELDEGTKYALRINYQGSEILFGAQGNNSQGFFARTTSTPTEEKYFYMTFTAQEEEYDIIIGFPRPYGYYFIDGIDLWEV